MDILTPRGQQTRKDELKGLELFQRKKGKIFHYIETDKSKPVVVDGIIYNRKTNVVVAVNEFKCRYRCTLESFLAGHAQNENGFNGEWLITARKIDEAAELAYGLQVPLTGMIYLVDDPIPTLLWDTLMRADGTFPTLSRTMVSATQATCNGGLANRMNMYFDIRKAMVMR